MSVRKMDKLFIALLLSLIGLLVSCGEEKDSATVVLEPDPIMEEYGMILNDFEVVRDTVMSGDTFGGILSNHGVSQAKIYEVATTFREVFDVRKIGVGRPYVLLK